MFELTLQGVKKYMEATLVLRNISFEVYAGDKVGIVGANGSGKSTVLKLIAGILKMHYYPGYPQTSSPGYDEGLIHRPSGATIAYLEQMPSFPEGLKVIDVLNMAFEDVHKIEKQMRDLEEQMQTLTDAVLEKALMKYSELVQLYEGKGGYEIQEKLGKVCTGLKFSDAFLNQDFDLLSGGEKRTVMLGKLLVHDPDILLLDEPTNHLDMDALEWLEGYLKSYKGIVLIVSHDRYFLDQVVTKIVEIEDMESITYKGNYSSFVSQKEENMRIQFEHFREQQKKITSMETTVKDLRDWAMRADNTKFFKRAASIQKKLAKMERIDRPVFERRNMRLNVKQAERSGNETIKAAGLSKSYGDKVLLKNADLMIRYGERVGLIGGNGSGKTTFLKMLLGEVKPDAGVVEAGANVMAAYLPQIITFNNEQHTVLECFRENISIPEGKAREYLAKFMFYKNTVFKKVNQLSGGERIRLKLGMLLYQDVNLLILDEPTNHLDIDSIETLEEALEEFTGTIFFISHDRYFINKISQRIVALEDFAFKSYFGNYDEYKRQKSKQIPAQTIVKEKKRVETAKQMEAAETTLAKVERLEKELVHLDSLMGDELDYDKLSGLHERKMKTTAELDEAMEEWMKE
ncbi:ribosomal protection-like ABC-F family protein [Metabacillus indicus]|uniref:ribosomal protection-like ABC-F family protein n=1 Tax=Metabacillus indicus TaxID=246786 RepID=UPI00049364B6|nr:ABC-F family ATP-binding cassette domain-containing protein [Metabacillus indicus]KEZ48200.1 ABC transporter ATP-binding protein [Metabacillus indicus LMG 22858]